MQIFAIFYWFCLVISAKQYLFKSCEENGFCKRNIDYCRNKLQTKISNYFIEDAIEVGSEYAVISGLLTKKLPNSDVKLPFQLSFLENDNIRFTLDENRNVDLNINANRFKASEHVLPHELRLKDSTSITIHDGAEKILLLYKDFKIEVFVNETLQMTINEDKFLNLEHFRNESDNQQQLLPEESDFNMFRDNFKDSTSDKLPLGPESIGLDFNFVDFHNAYGIPEHSKGLKLEEEIYRLYNVDIFEYEVDSNLPMYGSIPFLLVSKPRLSMGLFWINSADTYINLSKPKSGAKTHWMSENGVLDFIIFFGESPAEVNKKYGEITGFPTLPQLFALGYHQCRWNYNDQKDLLEINSLFDEHQIPYDSIWLDIEYTDNKQYFTWNSNFPDPSGMLDELDLTGRNLIIIIDPHIKKGSKVSNHLQKNGLTLMNSENDTFYGHCWPGESLWVDSFNPGSQEYWDELHRLSPENKVFFDNTNIHLWNDMNEISVFDGPETSSPRDNLQYGGYEERSLHNLNGRKFHDMTYSSLSKRLESTQRQRPFVLTRSFFAGSQKSAAMWTGDNMSKWEYLKLSIPMLLNNGVAGMPFGGADVGGFFGNPSKDLLTRWYQTGIWYPFFRGHAHIDSRRREPWVPGEPYTSIIRDAINLRYTLLPEFYNAFRESSISGMPILKPLFYESQKFSKNYDIEDEFFLGNSGILVKPVTEETTKEVTIVFPDSEIYYDFTNGKISSRYHTQSVKVPVTLSDIPMVIKGGSIISRKMRYRRSSKLMNHDPYTLVVAPSSTNSASGSLYVDDYESFDYKNGSFLVANFELKNGKLTNKVTGTFNAPRRIEKILILNTHATKVEHDGASLRFKSIDGNLEIQNPGLHINEDWNIVIKKDLVHDEL
ncbi:glucosidase II [Yamadazyma tenuis ATCC 10573]|uniref:Glucosidase II subunit alpha n=1 Tax=Candida tenuis (strain ATCC 10573 / BCRC 21748 / CBS 615 / JCM 9827 / NBRC 10315 / NRRL Y-1498 / VKM Y-70) TaxID=590646 RepID=G3B5I6_CANTC|nr:glucosidase II [Yamadazyma tenuis ATCC 10573]EGV63237.1 glucosidase II [Yamadazyma tenuis ATCC 10573]